MYEAGSYPFGYIGPISIIWQALATASYGVQPTKVPSTASKPISKRKRKKVKKDSKDTFLDFSCLFIKEEVLELPSESPTEEIRTVWIQCHPAIFSTVLS